MEEYKGPSTGPNNIELEIDNHHNQAINSRNIQDPLRYRKKALLWLIIILVFIIILDITIAAILGSSNKSCDNNERPWLIVWAVINSISVVMAFCVRKFVFNGKNDKKGWALCCKIMYLIVLVFNLVWIIVGSVQLFTDDSCYDTYYSMFAMVLAILVMSYIGISVFLLACCAACVFGVGLSFVPGMRLRRQQRNNNS